MRPVYVVLLPTVSAAVGCAAPGGDGVDADAATTTSAVVVVERATDATQATRTEASARFVRVPSSTAAEAALRSVGAALDLPPAGGCAHLSSLRAVASPPAVAELLDVGGVSLETGGVATRLLPRQLPDVTDVVSGIVYARATEASMLPASADYVVHVSGGAGLGSIDVKVLAPADPANVHVTSEQRDGNAAVIRGATVGFEWPEDGSGDGIYVDVSPSGVRCLLEPGGHAVVTAAFFDDAGTLSLHRLHREVLQGPGLDAGEVRFDFARTLAYMRR